MSEQQETQETNTANGVELGGLYAFKVGMSAVFNEQGERIPVTVLKYEQMVVSQLKTVDKDGYAAVQVAFVPSRASQVTNADKKRLTAAGFENGAKFVRELRLDEMPEGLSIGQKIALESLKAGDTVRLTAKSRGRGFSGAVRRWNFNGGPASHGSGFHRKPGSVGNRTWPGRVIPGKKMAGHFGDETVTVKNVEVVNVIPEESVLLVKGAVPGARNSLVRLMKA